MGGVMERGRLGLLTKDGVSKCPLQADGTPTGVNKVRMRWRSLNSTS